MPRRIALALLTLVGLAGAASCFAPAPVYREPPKAKVSDLARAMEGTWEVEFDAARLARAGIVGRSIRIRIQNGTWCSVIVRNGVEREGAKYEVVLDPKQSPATLDLKRTVRGGPGRAGNLERFAMKGIIKVEGDTLTVCYATEQNAERPRGFEENQEPNRRGRGRLVRTMTYRKVK